MIGRTISHYDITEKLGEGGMGEVYLATDTKLGREVALKFIPAAFSKDPDARDRLLREAQAASRLSHPNIMTVHSIDREGDRDFIVMEYVAGQPLNDYCKSEQKSVPAVLDLIIQLAEGIEKAHASGVIHRDLKPANILVDADGRARILDFGLAKIEGAVKLTQTGSTLGTMAYFSPEQAQGRPVDRRSDLFSFGVVLYEVLTQTLPFGGEHQAAIVYSIVHEQPQPMARFNHSIPADLERLVAKCLAKSPDERYQSASDVLADLRRVRTELVRFPGAAPRKRPMLAILPFANLGPADDEYFADGMTEEIISRMAAVEGLGVISRTSVMRYKKSDKSLREIGSELGADYILEGTVRWGRTKDGPSRVRITPQLIRVADDTHLWSDRYDRTLEDVFDVQSSIARQVFENLNVNLLGRERDAMAERPTRSAEAYNAYLQALAFRRRPNYSLSNLDLVVERLTVALQLDPDFALAHAALSVAHSDIYFHGYDLTKERIELSRQSVNRALELNPDLSQAHAALGLFHYRCFLDYPAAERELRWAFEKTPNDDDVRLYLAAVRRRQGHFEDFLALTKESLARNPRDPGLPAEIATTCMLLRRYDEAERYANLALTIQPDAEIVHLFSGMRLVHAKGDLESARAFLKRIDWQKHQQWLRFACQLEMYARDWDSALSLIRPTGDLLWYEQLHVTSRSLLEGLIYQFSDRREEARRAFLDARSLFEAGLEQHVGDARFYSSLGIVHAGLGDRDEARRHAQKAVELYPTSRDHVSGPGREIDLAITLALIGDVEGSLEVIERVLSRPAWFSIHQVKLEPAFDALRNHPRYAAMLAKDYPPF